MPSVLARKILSRFAGPLTLSQKFCMNLLLRVRFGTSCAGDSFQVVRRHTAGCQPAGVVRF